MSRDHLIVQARAAYGEREAAKATRDALVAKRGELSRELAQAKAKREKLQERHDHITAERMLSGFALTGVRTERRFHALARADEDIGGYLAALPMLDAQIAEAAQAIELTEAPIVAAVVELVAEPQPADIAEVRTILASLAAPLARLKAGDLIRKRLIGDSYPLPDGATPPIGGERLASSLLDAVPSKLRPEELADDALIVEAERLAAATLRQICD